MEDLKKSLHEHETLVLLALAKNELEQEQLAKQTNLSPDSIAHACLWLQSKGLVDIKEQKTEYVELNQEGLEYAKEGLPERQALNAIQQNAKTIEQLKQKLGEKKTKIALSWLMRKNS